MKRIARLDVVIPARNEELLIERCLASVVAAATFLHTSRPWAAPTVTISVVADSCTDATEELCHRFDGVRVVQVEFARVGAARALGVQLAAIADGPDASQQWIANTDADSVVPRNWLAHQVMLAESGFDLMIGTVRPPMKDLSSTQRREWRRTHIEGRPNGHVHGANLGFRADRYVASGGYRDLAEHEDNDLVDRMLALGCTSVASDECEVVTSGRRMGRTPGGYAGYLRGLDGTHTLAPTVQGL